MNPMTEGIIRQIFDGELPEVPAVFYEPQKDYKPELVEMEVLPYTMMALYTEDEMMMVNALPGSVDEVATVTGFERDYVEKTLYDLAADGKIMHAPVGYAKMPTNIVLSMDQLFFTRDNAGKSFDQKTLDTLRLIAMTSKKGEDLQGETDLRSPMRVIPKWNSIKNVPGVMPCENMKEILLENQAAEELVSERCTCKMLGSLWATGQCPNEENDKPGYPKEGPSPKTGHCLQLGRIGKYYQEYIKGYAPDREETLKKLEEAEAADVIYVATNSKEITNICCCNLDYCSPNRVGAWKHIPSRFRPVKKEEKCVNCGACFNACQFKAIDSGTFAIDPDLCKGCGNCVIRCAQKALKMEIVHPVEWIEDTGNGLWLDD